MEKEECISQKMNADSFNICVILASLKMFSHLDDLLYHLTINVG